MAITINDNFQNNSPKSLDAKYTKFVAGAATPYASVAEANSLIPSGYRSVGLTVLIDISGVNVEHWYKEGIGDVDLVPKNQVTASNGTNIVNNNVKLGGILSESTTIEGDNKFFNLGAQASPLNNFYLHTNNIAYLGGLLALKHQSHSSNSDFIVPDNTGILQLNDSTLSANRIITLPTPSPFIAGSIFIVYNTGNNASFFFQFDIPIIDIKTGITFTQIDHRTCHVLSYTAGLQWIQILKY